MHSLGIIGGLGPMATARLLARIIEMTDAKTDQDHLDVIVFNRPAVPDRTAYLLDHTQPSPLPSMLDTAGKLEQLGVGCICAPCITSHYFYDQLAQSVSVPFLNMVRETARELALEKKKKAGIMATSGTVGTGLFQRAMEDLGLAWAVPDSAHQTMVMSLIYDYIKAGRPPAPALFLSAAGHLLEMGCDSIILGCTELSLVEAPLRNEAGTGLFLDALDLLAKRAISFCGGPLKQEFHSMLA